MVRLLILEQQSNSNLYPELGIMSIVEYSEIRFTTELNVYMGKLLHSFGRNSLPNALNIIRPNTKLPNFELMLLCGTSEIITDS